jgi:DNA sulfur modification protein DndD
MIFESIEIDNFLCFYMDNELTFGETTLILGQNNTGKSKLFDALNWGMFGIAYHTETEAWRDGEDWKLGGIDLINRRALKEAQAGSDLSAQVTLYIDCGGVGHYEIQRSLWTRVTNSGSWESCTAALTLFFRATSGDTRVYKEREAQLLINTELAPSNLQPYFLFQGESVSQLLKLSDKQAYGKAINEMARIDVLDEAIRVSKTVRDRMNRRLRDARSADLENKSLMDSLSDEIASLDQNLEEANDEKIRLGDEYRDVSQKIDSVNAELSKYSEYSEKQLQKGHEQEVLREKMKRHEDHIATAEKQIPDWVTIPAVGLLKEFRAMYGRLHSARLVPQPVDASYLREMLHDRICKICDRKLDSASIEHVHLLLEKIEGTKAVEALRENYTLIGGHVDNVDRARSDIREWSQSKSELYAELQQHDRLVRQLQKELDQLQPSDKDPVEVRDQFAANKKLLVKLDRSRTETEYAIQSLDNKTAQWKLDFAEKRAQLKKLSISFGNEKEVWCHEVSERLYEAAQAIKDEYRRRIADGILNKANQYFHEMTARNQAAVGNLKLDLRSGGVSMVNRHDEPIDNVNQATRVSMQLSFVAGLLSEAGEALGTYFPFVADAPVSSLGGDNKLAAVESMTNAFEQSIIILKDDVPSKDRSAIASDAIRVLARSDPIEKAYLLEMSEGDTDTQHTLIRSLKELK